MDDILLFRGPARSGLPATAKTDVDLKNIVRGRSEYDVNFYEYIFNSNGTLNQTEFLLKGQSFYVDQSSRTRLETSLQLNKSGKYTYYLEVEYEYYGKNATMKTGPVTFLYLANSEEEYQYNKSKLKKFHLMRKCSYEDNDLYYDIFGRTMVIYDTKTIFCNNDFQQFYELIDTIVIEEGTKEIEAWAFSNVSSLWNVTTMYLPQSLEKIDISCFIIKPERLITVYYGGTEAEWDSLIKTSENDRFEILESLNIIYNYDSIPSVEKFYFNQ